jgi:tetratricopeptide (TPR) repeat protein
MSLWEEQTKAQFASADTPQKRAAIYLSLADTLLSRRLWKEARETFQKVVELRCDDAQALNNFAWALVVTPRSDFYDPALALRAAQRAVELAPNADAQWNTLGVALYRTGNYAKAIEALEKSRALKHGNDSFSHDAFFFAMAHYRLGHLDQARDWYTQSIAWMDKNAPEDEELLSFRSEATELLHVANPTTAPVPASRPQPGSIGPTTSESARPAVEHR